MKKSVRILVVCENEDGGSKSGSKGKGEEPTGKLVFPLSRFQFLAVIHSPPPDHLPPFPKSHSMSVFFLSQKSPN